MQQLTLSQVSLQKQPSSITEMYIPLWVYSSGSANATLSTPSSSLLQKGSTNTNSPSQNATKLHTLNSSWTANQKFAFEVSIWNGSSSFTTYAALWDITAGAIVSSSQISTSSTTATLIRSGQFTLTPGHSYGVALWTSSSSGPAYLTKAHLVAFLS